MVLKAHFPEFLRHFAELEKNRNHKSITHQNSKSLSLHYNVSMKSSTRKNPLPESEGRGQGARRAEPARRVQSGGKWTNTPQSEYAVSSSSNVNAILQKYFLNKNILFSNQNHLF
jgi:hypothetical protein